MFFGRRREIESLQEKVADLENELDILVRTIHGAWSGQYTLDTLVVGVMEAHSGRWSEAEAQHDFAVGQLTELVNEAKQGEGS